LVTSSLRKLAFKKNVLIHAKYFYREVLFFFFYFSSQLFDYTPYSCLKNRTPNYLIISKLSANGEFLKFRFKNLPN